MARGHQVLYNDDNFVMAGLISSSIIAFGKLGGVVAAMGMHRWWVAPESNSDRAAWMYVPRIMWCDLR